MHPHSSPGLAKILPEHAGLRRMLGSTADLPPPAPIMSQVFAGICLEHRWRAASDVTGLGRVCFQDLLSLKAESKLPRLDRLYGRFQVPVHAVATSIHVCTMVRTGVLKTALWETWKHSC
jgi:hypothetical protein